MRLAGLSGNRQMSLITKQDLGAMNFIEKSLDVHARALDVRSRRMEVLARNIANAARATRVVR
jgi:hypothetical protein